MVDTTTIWGWEYRLFLFLLTYDPWWLALILFVDLFYFFNCHRLHTRSKYSSIHFISSDKRPWNHHWISIKDCRRCLLGGESHRHERWGHLWLFHFHTSGRGFLLLRRCTNWNRLRRVLSNHNCAYLWNPPSVPSRLSSLLWIRRIYFKLHRLSGWRPGALRNRPDIHVRLQPGANNKKWISAQGLRHTLQSASHFLLQGQSHG